LFDSKGRRTTSVGKKISAEREKIGSGFVGLVGFIEFLELLGLLGFQEA